MNELQVFTDKQFGEVRTLMVDHEPYFIGIDIAEILDYKEPNKAIVRHVDEDDRMKHPVIDDLGRKQETWIISESGLYSLILSSKLPTAKKFKRWVTSEVLPSIRKHGLYATDELLGNPDLAIKVFQELKKEREDKRRLHQQMESEKPYTNFGKALSTSDGGILIGEYAKVIHNAGIKIGQNRLFEWLRENGYLIKSGRRRNAPIQKYLEMGLFEVKETVVHMQDGDKIRSTTLITGKGQMYFARKLEQSEYNKGVVS
ncbi:BRO family protein [Tindallia californiensis]|uniref:Anti-repressor protein n=1 Tax=Tindallia californiensis TaxID=159292 RepID=A0A1H3R0L7_9FIRM|nr:phage antirepressor [Tindallia californiensis]SDZ19053.1 anti-repressor protein [Tindallia californiensis]